VSVPLNHGPLFSRIHDDAQAPRPTPVKPDQIKAIDCWRAERVRASAGAGIAELVAERNDLEF